MARNEYAEVLASLYRLEAARGMDFKLERVALALQSLGDPQTRFAAIHIAGTNGKGSVAAMLHAMYQAAGYRVGLYTSPHLLSFTERIRVGAAMIAEENVVALARDIWAAATVRGIDLTFFEFATVMAFLHFARSGVEIAVVEVGLGGRLDATNVLSPEIAVITTIGLDHQEFLGNTIESVAGEKAGIIKPGRPVIVGNVQPQVEEILTSVAAERQAPVFRLGRDFAMSASAPFQFSGMGCELAELRIALRGGYQGHNAATAIAASIQLRHKFPIHPEAVRRGLENVQWPGRLEVVQARPLVILDGAHNLDGMTALVQNLPGITGSRNIHLLFGVMRDKAWKPMIEAIAPRVTSATVTTVLPPRGESPESLAGAFSPYCRTRIAADPLTGLEVLLDSVGGDESIIVTGSLFLVGAVYPYFLRRRGHQALFTSETASPHP